jgi:DNA primase large subunit
MNNLKRLCKYPFLTESKKYVSENGISIEELLNDPLYERARIIGIERLYNALTKQDVGTRNLITDSDCIMELLSYPIARMIAVCIQDIYFRKRYALAEAIHFYKYLMEESTPFLVQISKEFNFKIRLSDEKNNIYLNFVDYLRYAPTRYNEWKMINKEMNSGFIKISHKDLSRILQEALRYRINIEIEKKECYKFIKKNFFSDIQKLQNRVKHLRKNVEIVSYGKLDKNFLPPCIKKLITSINSGDNVSHMGRFALVSFLDSLGLSTNDILKVFSTAPDFEEEKTLYQVKHITGAISSTKYNPPGCDKMRTYGICPVEEVDEICKKKRHPISYYKSKWIKQKGEK